MTELRKSIQDELESRDNPQLMLDLGGDEAGTQQRERDLAALRRSFNEITAEIEREAEHIRSRFRNPSARLFPVAVTFLVPSSMVTR